MWFKKEKPVVNNISVDFKVNDKLISEFISVCRILLTQYLTTNESDFKKLKIDIMRPILEQQWLDGNAQEADRINKALNSKGEKIRKAWLQYKDDLLALQREHKDTAVIEAKLEVLSKLMEGIE